MSDYDRWLDKDLDDYYDDYSDFDEVDWFDDEPSYYPEDEYWDYGDQP